MNTIEIEMQKVPASHGLLWLKHGFRLIMRSPLQAVSLALTSILMLFAISRLPVVGTFLLISLMPLLLVGYMQVCRSLEYSEKVSPLSLFAGFQQRSRSLVSLGGFLLIGIILISIVTAALGGPALNAILSDYQTHQNPDKLMEALFAPDSGIQLSLMSGFTLLFGLMLSMQFAPMLVFFNHQTPLAALKTSFLASLRNILPYSVYTLIFQLLAFMLSALPWGLGWLILVPIALTSVYVSYRDIFTDVHTAAPAENVDRPSA
jgi:uncharacterized membrane protein